MMAQPLLDCRAFIGVPIGGKNRVEHDIVRDWALKLCRVITLLPMLLAPCPLL